MKNNNWQVFIAPRVCADKKQRADKLPGSFESRVTKPALTEQYSI